MSNPKSISVLIPTLNCASLLPEHIKGLNEWIGLAAEVIIVDSFSTDGTIDLLKAQLSHGNIQFLDHPRGLYQSWNFGAQKARAKYIYISTVGDAITRHGIETLFEVAEKFQSDVVLSKPGDISAAGEALPEKRWLVDEILEKLNIAEPVAISTAEQFLFSISNAWTALLGSSASNLYRTECLQQRPFPTEYGTAGDGAWGLLNMLDVKTALTPERFSTYRHHEKAYALADYHVESLQLKLFRLAQETVAQHLPADPALAQVLEEVQWDELAPALDDFYAQNDALQRRRKKKALLNLHPAVLGLRMKRKKARRKIAEITARFIAARHQNA